MEWRLCAAAIAGRPAMRLLVRRRGRPTYPASTQRPLTDEPPATPAAVMLFDRHGQLHTLGLDLDASRGDVVDDAVQATMLLTEAGLRPFADVSPSGGRHVYALLPGPVPAHEAAQVAVALQRLLPSLDPAPLLNPAHGCLRPPGAVHKTGGHQRLLTPFEVVSQAVATPPPADAWRRLRTLLHADRITVEPSPDAVDAAPAVGVARRGIDAGYEQLAATGRHPWRAYASASEARMAVIGAAVRAGWGLTDVDQALYTRWSWLHASYADKYHTTGWRTRVAREFMKAKNSRAEGLCRRLVRDSDTSPPTTRGGLPSSLLSLGPAVTDPHLALRKFFAYATDYARRCRLSATQRSVLRAMVWVGQVQGRLVVNAGCRSVAEQAGCHFDTVAATLHELAGHGLVTRSRRHQGVEADLWQLNVDLAEQYRPVRGRIRGLHPVFRVIGGHDTAEVHDELQRATAPVTAAGLGTRLGYPVSRIHEQLRLLAGWQLAVRTAGGWLVGPGDPDALSHRLGGHDAWQAQHDRHAQQRQRWRQLLLDQGHLPHFSGQLAWDEEFALVADDPDRWVQDFAGGGPPTDLEQKVAVVKRSLGAVVG